MINGSKFAVWIYLFLTVLNVFLFILKGEELCLIIAFLSAIISASQAWGVKGAFNE